jgi:hypothetical protein
MTLGPKASLYGLNVGYVPFELFGLFGRLPWGFCGFGCLFGRRGFDLGIDLINANSGSEAAWESFSQILLDNDLVPRTFDWHTESIADHLKVLRIPVDGVERKNTAASRSQREDDGL